MQPRDITVHPLDRDKLTFRHRSLPHWEQAGGIYFVTFRLADSVPKQVLAAYIEERKELECRAAEAVGLDRLVFEKELFRLYCARIDRCMDVGLGACWMCRPEIALVVAGTLQHFDRDR